MALLLDWRNEPRMQVRPMRRLVPTFEFASPPTPYSVTALHPRLQLLEGMKLIPRLSARLLPIASGATVVVTGRADGRDGPNTTPLLSSFSRISIVLPLPLFLSLTASPFPM
ncbi:hypothetical protein K523DRAFT_322842 [Schizophyllum commune Tattone D]|nr:hypothetical protein K523DRAFT_322842 [Schizophyllum commune Tattone D]